MESRELTNRLAAADRIRRTLRRVTLEWRALGRRLLVQRTNGRGPERPDHGHLITSFTLLAGEEASGLNTADLVAPRSRRYAGLALGRSLSGDLRGETIRILTPEDFVLFKVLSTRDRDIEDAATVVRSLGPQLDVGAVDREARLLAAEIPDHDVIGCLQRVMALARQS